VVYQVYPAASKTQGSPASLPTQRVASCCIDSHSEESVRPRVLREDLPSLLDPIP
jgi:hypothetical protein